MEEIDTILKTESGIILLKKESEHSFFEAILNNWVSILSALFFLTRKKIDSLILTEKRVLLILRNKIYIEQMLSKIEIVNYNGVKSMLEIKDENKVFSIPLHKLRVSYEEGKLIRQKLSEFRS